MEQLHEHNQKTYENICRMYGEGIQRVAIVQPTGSGKSLLMTAVRTVRSYRHLRMMRC